MSILQKATFEFAGLKELRKMGRRKSERKNIIRSGWFRLPLVIIIAVLPVLLASKLFPSGEVGTHASLEEFIAHLDIRIPAIMEDYKIPGLAIALIQDGEPVWRQAYGYADIGAGRKMTTDSYYRTESISKSVTAWGVMKLVEEDRIELDAPVQRYIDTWEIPETEFAEEGVTLRRLLSCSSGMPLGTIGQYYSPTAEDIPSLKDILSKDAVLFREPGSAFFYSNTGFNILELLIEEVTGRDFAVYMKEEILGPLGMEEAGFEWSENFDPPVAKGYGMREEAIPVYVYPDKAAGGLFATLDGVARFASAGMTEFTTRYRDVLDPGTIEEMYSPYMSMSGYYTFVFDGYGLGHFIECLTGENAGSGGRDTDGFTKVVSHGGQGTGWMTDFHFIPERGDGIVILSNSQRTWPGFGYILSDWANWLGFTSIGMGAIVLVQKWAWVTIALGLSALMWQSMRLLDGFVLGTRRFAPWAKEDRLLRSLQGCFAVVCAALFLWIMSLGYWFTDSVLPIAGGWLNYIDLYAAFVLAASALLPSLKTAKAKKEEQV